MPFAGTGPSSGRMLSSSQAYRPGVKSPKGSWSPRSPPSMYSWPTACQPGPSAQIPSTSNSHDALKSVVVCADVAIQLALTSDSSTAEIDFAKKTTHDTLIVRLGDTRLSGVRWLVFDHEHASEALGRIIESSEVRVKRGALVVETAARLAALPTAGLLVAAVPGAHDTAPGIASCSWPSSSRPAFFFPIRYVPTDSVP